LNAPPAVFIALATALFAAAIAAVTRSTQRSIARDEA
jgi:hypothetical protein